MYFEVLHTDGDTPQYVDCMISVYYCTKMNVKVDWMEKKM